jgi:DnaK suppressor protein
MTAPRELLVEIRDELSARAAAIRDGSEMPSGGISFGKRVGEGTSIAIERFADVAVHGQVLEQLALVERAIIRADAGDYGRCDACGEMIPDARLEAIPWAATCVGCA